MKPALFALFALTLAACPPAGPPPKYPPRPAGCRVEIFEGSPPMSTENLGTVRSRCEESVTDENCLRGLQDQVCAMGGDVAWGVADKPTLQDGHKHYTARAAHRLRKP